MTYDSPTNRDDLIDVRGVIERFEELETELTLRFGDDKDELPEASAVDAWIETIAANDEHEAQDDAREFKLLRDFLNDMKGYGGDHQWKGDWYPVTLIRDSYFENYAREYADDIGATQRDMSWPYSCIDWKQAARELQMDYTSCEFDGVTYWYR